eukprot:Nk52_evm9s245 gene=Nk52_evmTU9s245
MRGGGKVLLQQLGRQIHGYGKGYGLFWRRSCHLEPLLYRWMSSSSKIKLGCTSVERRQPLEWVMPEGGEDTGVRVMNNLTKKKEPLIVRAGGEPISWYICGPTVYDQSHIGHACCYVRFDILRRVLMDYFRRDVYFVMGMTDIDDKIIDRARELKVSHVKLARSCEASFLRDLQNLNVLSPNVIVRVTEHIDEIIAFAEKIVGNGYGYVSGGDENGAGRSVYFDTQAFGARYGKLNPSRQQDEGDGEVELPTGEGEKRHPKDFALWKSIKRSDEPGWDSPWGKGRPGWHIECSAMCSNIFGDHLDIHSGGIDLMFPHHENEIAQCEAHHEVDQWANYFLHSGHLHVDHLKMSKSLKNFITIKEFLGKYTAVQFRLFCLTTKYNSPIDYSETQVNYALSLERKLLNFFNAVGNRLTIEQRYVGPLKDMWTNNELELLDKLAAVRVEVGEALRDDFDTPSVLHSIMDLISSCNVYLASNIPEEQHVPEELLGNVASYIDNLLRLFGIELNTKYEMVTKRTSELPFMNEMLDLFVTFRGDVRARTLQDLKKCKNRLKEKGLSEEEIKELKTQIKGYGAILSECDKVRDRVFPELGVAIKDSKETSSWEFVDPTSSISNESRDHRERVDLRGDTEEKIASANKKMYFDNGKEKRASNPRKYFEQTGLFSQYDEASGFPTHDKDGVELSKNKIKKCQKMWRRYVHANGKRTR